MHAFVCRNPDENHERVYRWLLERNLKMYAVAFAVDRHGDIYLDARLPLAAVTADELDRLLGSVLSTPTSRSTRSSSSASPRRSARSGSGAGCAASRPANLEAFRGWLESGDEPDAD